ncbi:dihydrouridine synthase [Apiospora rasikravindrae]|uniref:tRNA-dihydrouridine(47) synthase [NAD(P)(+)] n=1 Tax=Apiospora rasikravindrae TaxID=990691 RepID=A0ABR1RN95_9PEZI
MASEGPSDVKMDDTSSSVNGSLHPASKRENDSEVTQPEDGTEGPASKKLKTLDSTVDNRRRGIAAIKAESRYLISNDVAQTNVVDDDAAEGSISTSDPVNGKPDPRGDGRDNRDNGKKEKPRKKQKGQNKDRQYGHFSDAIKLCNSIAYSNEFSPRGMQIRGEGRREDLDTLGGKCPVFESFGRCPSGWKCRFVKSHSQEIEREDGRKELVLSSVGESSEPFAGDDDATDMRPGTVNAVTSDQKWSLAKKKANLNKSDKYIQWLNADASRSRDFHNKKGGPSTENQEDLKTARDEFRAQFVEPPIKASEKRKIYFGRETPVLAPLTTQGNLPFRRLCVELGAQVTYSEMAMGMPLIQGQKGDWALMKASSSEIAPPRYTPSEGSIVKGYENSKDLKFGAQISANQPWIAIKATEALTSFLPHLRVVDLNCGCPIDMVYSTGAGSGLLDAPNKMERMIRGMNTVSGEVPITAKLRMGVRDAKPNAAKTIERLAFGGEEQRDYLGAPGCAAVTLHGRSRQQRYTRSANWSYIAECAAMVKSYNQKKDDLTDTAKEPDASTQANTADGRMYFLGNGDCYSHVDYFDHVDNAKVDSVMIARGAMIKPWIFEEIEKGQYLDKSATERLGYIEKFCKFGMEAWGSDELGIGFTRRFLLEWLSFTHRYIPIGVLEHLPPSLQERPPAYRGRNELETLLASDNYKDWIKISEMYLGPAHPGFNFQPKHRSNSYEMEAEG